MTKITIFEKNGNIVGWQVKGHSGYAEEGADIVCAALSTAAEMGLEICLESGVPINGGVKKGFVFVDIIVGAERIQSSLRAMVNIFKEIKKQYGKYVKMEVKKDVS